MGAGLVMIGEALAIAVIGLCYSIFLTVIYYFILRSKRRAGKGYKFPLFPSIAFCLGMPVILAFFHFLAFGCWVVLNIFTYNSSGFADGFYAPLAYPYILEMIDDPDRWEGGCIHPYRQFKSECKVNGVVRVGVEGKTIAGSTGIRYFILESQTGELSWFENEEEFRKAWAVRHSEPIPTILSTGEYYAQHYNYFRVFLLGGIYLAFLASFPVAVLWLIHRVFRWIRIGR